MPTLSGKYALLELLRQEGAAFIFGNPGTTELPLMDALATETNPRYILGLHEGVVMGMADGYAQASRQLAVTNLHASPGVGNAMGMLYNAQEAGAPILVTAGQHEQSLTASEPILWSDLTVLARPFVKWSGEVRRLADLPRLVHRAAKTALAPPTGPVFLSIPADVLNETATIDLGAPTRIGAGIRGDAAAVAAAAKRLAGAKRPVIIAGDAVAQSHAQAEVVAIAEMLAAPVYAEGLPSTASFPGSHPLFAGAMVRSAPAMRAILEQHDVLFSIGGDLFTMSLPAAVEPLPSGITVVHLDTDPWELGKNYPAAVAILGEPKATLPDLLARLEVEMSAEQRALTQRRKAEITTAIARDVAQLRAAADAESSRTPIQARALLRAIGGLLPPDAIVVEETLSSGVGLRQLISSDRPGSFFGMRGGGIGWGMPAALGAKLAHPNCPTVSLIGDGGAMFSIQALWSAAHEQIPVVFVIFNNRSYRILKQRLRALRGSAEQAGRYPAMDLDNPPIDFVGLASSLGVRGDRIENLSAFRECFVHALRSGQPHVIDVSIDPEL